MTGNMRITVTEVTAVLEQVNAQFEGDCSSHGQQFSEDYADAYHSVGQLMSQLSAEMLYQVYKDDNDVEVKHHMEMVRSQAKVDADEAWSTLSAWGIRQTSIDDI